MNLSRRDFTAAAALASSAAALGAQPTTLPAPPKRTLRKAIMVGMINVEGSLEDKLRAAKDAGFQGIEGDSPSPINDDLIAAANKVGIAVHGMVNSTHWSIPLNTPDPAAATKADESLATCL